ncbi:MAG: bile acid:sodium symporter family protein [Akkermansiaceae bacterium]|nr:bile acid:sodium symporter family protein [Akkermansiaceae bacterium]MCP5550132.1 bile acid:sodium symporter family protein [Akkermansiaceae bacterium]MCP5551994.1 bile acid:sodium symporter family protein [Akkermansiaceae bacterium]
MKRFFDAVTNLFALWTVLGSAWAWFFPPHFTWFVDPANRVLGATLLNAGLGLIMFGMGITLRFEDFREVLKTPGRAGLGVLAQFLVMPALGFGLARAFSLETGLAVGLILVSCCPGGTASNVVTYLARGNLALSVLMTFCSTLAAIVLTPLLTGFLAGKYVEVNRLNLFLNMLAVVLVPVLAGLALNRFLPRLVRFVTPWSPVLSVLVIVLIVGGIIGASKETIRAHFGVLMLVVFLLHACGFGLGYAIAKLFRLPLPDRRTLSIEVGMQNSGLGSGLAKTPKFVAQFPDPAQALLAPVPCAISALYHCLIGSFLAARWRREREEDRSR